jgi:hypothetical protein
VPQSNHGQHSSAGASAVAAQGVCCRGAPSMRNAGSPDVPIIRESAVRGGAIQPRRLPLSQFTLVANQRSRTAGPSRHREQPGNAAAPARAWRLPPFVLESRAHAPSILRQQMVGPSKIRPSLIYHPLTKASLAASGVPQSNHGQHSSAGASVVAAQGVCCRGAPSMRCRGAGRLLSWRAEYALSRRRASAVVARRVEMLQQLYQYVQT